MIAGENQIRHGEDAILDRNRRQAGRRKLEVCQIVNLIRRQIEEVELVKVAEKVPVELRYRVGADVEAFDVREILKRLVVARRSAVVHDVLEPAPKRFVVSYRQPVERF